MRVYTATVVPGISDKDSIRLPESETANDALDEQLAELPEHGEMLLTAGTWASGEDLCDIAARYDVGTMSGTDVVHFANDLIATGVNQTDALAVTWPINCRNLLQKVGKEAAAPKIESWDDVVRLHRARRNLAERRFQHSHSEHLGRLIILAESLHLAASDYDWSGPGH